MSLKLRLTYELKNTGSIGSGFGLDANQTLRGALTLCNKIPPEIFHEIIQKFFSLVVFSPSLVKTLVRRLMYLPDSQSTSCTQWLAHLVSRRILKRIEYTQVPFAVFSSYFPEDNPNLRQFSFVVSNKLSPFLHGNLSLSLTQIFEILCFLNHHLTTTLSKIQAIASEINADGRFDGDYSNEFDVMYDCFVFFNESIRLFGILLEYIEPALPICQRIFERYKKMLL